MTAPNKPSQIMPKTEDLPVEPDVMAEELSSEVAEALKALDRLIQITLSDNGPRAEARHQVNRLAVHLVKLVAPTAAELASGSRLKIAWENLATDLAELAEPIPTSIEAIEGEEEAPSILSEEELSRRLSMTIPAHLRLAGNQEVQPDAGEPIDNTRRVLVASLESQRGQASLVNHTAASFPRERWSVINLGVNVPILALMGTVMETRPSVLILVIEQGQFMSETVRLISDLKRQLFGLRVVAVGPALAQPNLTERLRADLYSSEVTQAAQLADQFFNPLNRLGDSLNLSMELTSPATEPAELTLTVPEGATATEELSNKPAQ